MKTLRAIIAALLFSAVGYGQSYTVTATVPAFSNGAAVATFVNGGGGNPTTTVVNAPIDNSGFFRMSLAPNTAPAFAPSTWNVQICSQTPSLQPTCYTASVVIATNPQDISLAFANAPKVAALSGVTPNGAPSLPVTLGTGLEFDGNVLNATAQSASGALTPYGQIFNAASFTSLPSNFTANGATPVVAGGGLQFTGGNVSAIDTYDLNYFTDLPRWKLTATYTLANFSSSSFGLGFGLRGASTLGQYSGLSGLIQVAPGSGITPGTVAVFAQINNTGGLNVISSSANAIPNIAANDILQIVMTRNYDVVTVTAQDITTGSPPISVQGTFPYIYGATYIQPNIGKFCIWNFGGTGTLLSLNVQSDYPVGLANEFIGDSKTAGFLAGTLPASFAAITSTVFQSGTLAGGGEGTQDVLNRMPEILATKPQNLVLNIGRNDLANSVPLQTIETNYTSIVNQLTAAGIKVYNLLPIYETVVDQSALTAWLQSTYPATQNIDTLGVNSSALGLLAPDNIHPNALFHGMIATRVIGFLQGKLPTLNYQSYAWRMLPQ